MHIQSRTQSCKREVLADKKLRQAISVETVLARGVPASNGHFFGSSPFGTMRACPAVIESCSTIFLRRSCSGASIARNSTPIPWDPDHRTVALLTWIGVASAATWRSSSTCMPVKGRRVLSNRQPLMERSFTKALYRNLSRCTRVLGAETGNRGNFRTTI